MNLRKNKTAPADRVAHPHHKDREKFRISKFYYAQLCIDVSRYHSVPGIRMAVPPESVLVSVIAIEMFNSMIGAKVMAIMSSSIFSEFPEHINT